MNAHKNKIVAKQSGSQMSFRPSFLGLTQSRVSNGGGV